MNSTNFEKDNYDWFIEKIDLCFKHTDQDFSIKFQSMVKENVSKIDSYIESKYQEYYDQSKKGVSFLKRREISKWIELAKSLKEKRINASKNPPVFSDFIQEGDAVKIERMGIERFIELYVL